MSQRPTALTQNTSTNRPHLALAVPACTVSVPPATVPLPPSPVARPATPVMSEDTHRDRSYAGVPKLTKLNYYDWAMQVEAYLTGAADHWRVIEGEEKPDGSYDRPAPPTDRTSKEGLDWKKSSRVACGVLMATAGELHAETVLEHKGRPYEMWKAVEAQHLLRDASLRHEAWMQFLAMRKKVDETYVDYYRRVDAAYAKVKRITPKNQTAEQRGQELTLFQLLSGLPHDDSLRRSLTAQRDVNLEDTFAAFMRTDAGDHARTESANAAASGSRGCFLCDSSDHFARDCPHREAITQLVVRRNGNNNGNGRGRRGRGNGNGNGNSNGARANAASTSGTNAGTTADGASTNTSTSTTNAGNTPAQESAGVATLFLTSSSHLADSWLCDSGASSTMSSDRSAFRDLKPDRRAIRLADGKVVYSEGLGSIHFLSACGYIVTIDDALYVPRLAANLFAPNKFAKQHRDSISEVTEYPMRKWVNRRTGATEFTATIRSNDLAYLDWGIAPRHEAASVSIEQVHARLNHIPFPAVRQLIRDGSVDGVPDRLAGAEGHDGFCEDCVNGKLSRAPHTKPTTRAERPLYRVFSDVHGPIPIRSRRGSCYWVTFIDDYSRFPAVYFIAKKSDVFAAFRQYKAWAENVTGHRIGIFRDDKGSEYMSHDFNSFLTDAGIRREHSVRDTPQQLGVAERMNRSIAEGITTALSQSGLSRTWWEDAATHWLYAKIRLPSSATAPLTPFELFYGRKPSLTLARPFGSLAYVHLQKDQHPPLTPHAAQCIFIGYPTDYKAWRFWNPNTQREVISDSAVFRESVFPHRKPGLAGLDRSIDLSLPLSTPIDLSTPEPPIIPFHSAPEEAPAPTLAPEPMPSSTESSASEQAPAAPRLTTRLHVLPPIPPPPPSSPASNVPDLPERPRTPPAVKRLTTHFEHHPSVAPSLPPKRASRARQPGALAEASLAGPADDIAIPLVDAVECALSTSESIEPRSLAEALKRPDADKWVAAALAEIEAHLQNGTWELAQLPPGRRAIGSRWVFKIKRTPEGFIDKYKGRVVAQGFSQIQGIHYNEVFASTARMAAMRTVMAIAAAEDLELESVDVSTAFLNGEIDAEIYMKIPEGLEVEGDPQPGEDPKRWVVRLLKGLYGIKQGPRIWALKLHLVLLAIGFERIDCDHSVYVYQRGDVRIMVPIHVDDLLLASNSKPALQKVKAELTSHFKIHDQGPTSSILGIKVERDRVARTISLSQPGYIQSILEQFSMSDCNPTHTPMEENLKLSTRMSPDTPEERAEMKAYPYRELIGKLLYLAVATRPDIAYVVGVLCRFVENPGMDHWNAAKRVLRYLKGTADMRLVYSRWTTPDPFITYSDADLSGNPDNSRSTGGFAVCVGGGATQWGSRLQPHVSLSSTESEYTTASKVGCEVTWMRYLFEELGYDMSRPSPLLVDNKSAIQVAKHPEHQSTMKHVHRAYHWIRDQVEQRQISVSHVPGDENPADIFTKPLGRLKFTKFRAMLGLCL